MSHLQQQSCYHKKEQAVKHNLHGIRELKIINVRNSFG